MLSESVDKVMSNGPNIILDKLAETFCVGDFPEAWFCYLLASQIYVKVY